jgi:hypothetical protein
VDILDDHEDHELDSRLHGDGALALCTPSRRNGFLTHRSCCLIKDVTLTVEQEKDPAKKHARAVVKLHVGYSWLEKDGAGKDSPCKLQWWEKSDVIYYMPSSDPKKPVPRLKKSTWTEMSRAPNSIFDDWRSKMNEPLCPTSGSVDIEDHVSFGLEVDPLHPNEPPAKARKILGKVRVFSGCPEGPKASRNWFQIASVDDQAGVQQSTWPPRTGLPPESPNAAPPSEDPPDNPVPADQIAGAGEGTEVSSQQLAQPRLSTDDPPTPATDSHWPWSTGRTR